MQIHEEEIRQRAYQLYKQRAASGNGNGHGSHALDDWLQAEKEIRIAEDEAVDEALKESFPASDPPAY